MPVDRLAVVIAAAPRAAWASPGALAEHIKSAMREPAEVTRERVARAVEEEWLKQSGYRGVPGYELPNYEGLADAAIDAMQRVNQ